MVRYSRAILLRLEWESQSGYNSTAYRIESVRAASNTISRSDAVSFHELSLLVLLSVLYTGPERERLAASTPCVQLHEDS